MIALMNSLDNGSCSGMFELRDHAVCPGWHVASGGTLEHGALQKGTDGVSPGVLIPLQYLSCFQ